MAFFAGDLSQTNRSVNLASMQRFWGWEAWTQVRGDNQEGRQVKKKKANKTTTTKENYIFKKRMRNTATSRVNSVTELTLCN